MGTAIACARLPGMEPVSRRTKRLISGKAERFTESVIREMTRQAMLYGAINLAQGFPDFAAPEEIKRDETLDAAAERLWKLKIAD